MSTYSTRNFHFYLFRWALNQSRWTGETHRGGLLYSLRSVEEQFSKIRTGPTPGRSRQRCSNAYVQWFLWFYHFFAVGLLFSLPYLLLTVNYKVLSYLTRAFICQPLKMITSYLYLLFIANTGLFFIGYFKVKYPNWRLKMVRHFHYWCFHSFHKLPLSLRGVIIRFTSYSKIFTQSAPGTSYGVRKILSFILGIIVVPSQRKIRKPHVGSVCHRLLNSL